MDERLKVVGTPKWDPGWSMLVQVTKANRLSWNTANLVLSALCVLVSAQ